MRTGIKRSNIIESKFAKLWISKSCRDWECALEEYWTPVKPSHLALEKKMDSLDPDKVREMNADLAVDLRELCKGNETYERVRKEWKKNTKKFESKKTSKKTKKNLRTKSFGLLTLFAAEAGLPRIAGYGAGKVGQWIRYFENQAQNKDAYEKWTPSAKRK